MADRRTLEILLKTIADKKGVDEVKGGLGELKGAAQSAGSAFDQLGSLIGLSLGGGAVALIANVLNGMRELADQELKFSQDVLKSTEQLNRQERQWFATAGAASSFFDVVRLGLTMNSEVQQLADKLHNIQQKQLTGFQEFQDGLARFGNALNNNPLMTGTFAQQKSDETAKAQKDLADALVRSASAWQRGTDASKEWAQLQSGPVDAAINKTKSNIADLEGRIAKINPAASVEQNTQFVELNSQLATEYRHLQELESAAKKLNQAEDRSGRVAFNREITALLREQGTVLQNIHEQERLVREAPFLGIDEKQAALLSIYQREMAALSAQITALKAAAQNSALDPAQLQQVNQKLQQTQFEFELLGLKMVGIQKPFQASMIQWANSFGTAGDQVAKSLQATIGTSLQSLNQMLISGRFNAQSLVESLANIGLQLIENLAIQQIMAAFARTQQTQRQAAATQELAVQAPLAAATSVSSYGTAAIAATVAIGVIGAIIAALSLHEGGPVRRRRMHSGGLAADEVPIIAQEGEIMIQRSVAQQPGMADFLLALNAGMFHKGGGIRRYHGGRRISDDWYDPGSFGGTPSSFTPPRGQGPIGNFPNDFFDPNFEPPPLPDPNFGPPSTTARGNEPAWSNYDPSFQQISQLWGPGFGGFGITPFGGISMFGPTQIPTIWTNYPGVGFVPMAVPPGGWTQEHVLNIGTSRHSIIPKTKHTGGPIGRFHLGGAIGRFPRLHGGGSLGGGSLSRSAGAPQVHVYPVMDRRAIVKDMASREGKKLIFDVIHGRRIDLGL